jgi:F-type H+-transporting ATPase subunit gamma
MANIKEIVSKISSITSTQQITKAMKMVAASKLNKVQNKVVQMRRYTKDLDLVVESITASNADSSSFVEKYLEQRAVKNILFIVMASDKGLCGSFNANTIKYALSEIKKVSSMYHEAKISVMPIGEKVLAACTKQNFEVIKDFVGVVSNPSMEGAQSVAEFAKKSFLSKQYDKIVMVYSSFKSIATQEPVSIDYLPMVFSEKKAGSKSVLTKKYIYEPSQGEMMSILVPKLLEIKVYNALLESSASEHSARMMTMNKATDNAGEMLKSLKISYNRTRQAAITQEISEIVSGAEALSK